MSETVLCKFRGQTVLPLFLIPFIVMFLNLIKTKLIKIWYGNEWVVNEVMKRYWKHKSDPMEVADHHIIPLNIF